MRSALASAAKSKRSSPREHFIQGAIKRPGSLHRALNIPEGQTIPAARINAAANSSDTNLRRKAQFAKTLKGLSGK